MFSIDERLRGLPAVKEQVVQLHQSLNAPHLAVPGRKAGPATGYVLGLRGPSGFAVFVYLYLAESGECAVYVPSNGSVPADAYQSEEAEALGFTESMGFIMDNLNFRARPTDEQDQMIRALPIFQREPPPPGEPAAAPGATKPATGKTAGVVTLGKLFAAFCLSLVLTGCVHVVTEEERITAKNHYELAVTNLTKNAQAAMKDIEDSLQVNPQAAESWLLKGLLLHNSFGRLEEAQQCYVKAIELRTPYPEAHYSLGNLYMDFKRWDDAIAQYEIALNDVLYAAPFQAQSALGMAYFKKGDGKAAIDHLKTAITMHPGFCLGYLQLGTVYEASGAREDSCKYYSRYREHCPEQPDAYQREGLCQQAAGQNEAAKKSFETCVEKSKSDDQKDLCKSLAAQVK
jgi:tetratricopeptide (TPR) repeat protein